MRLLIGDAGGVLCFTTRYLYLLQIFLSPGPGRPLGDHTPRHTLRAAGSQLQVSVIYVNHRQISELTCAVFLPSQNASPALTSEQQPGLRPSSSMRTFLLSPVPVRWQNLYGRACVDAWEDGPEWLSSPVPPPSGVLCLRVEGVPAVPSSKDWRGFLLCRRVRGLWGKIPAALPWICRANQGSRRRSSTILPSHVTVTVAPQLN